MDWSQASLFEVSIFGLGFMAFIALAVLVVFGIFYGVKCSIEDRLVRVKRMKKTTLALKCEACECNVGGECGQFGISTSNAPVFVPGCSWGIEEEVD